MLYEVFGEFDITPPLYNLGIDMQGIPWKQFGITRAKQRENRLRRFHPFSNEPYPPIQENLERLGHLVQTKPWEYYSFARTTRYADPQYGHFQLRNLVWAPSSSEIYYYAGHAIRKWSAQMPLQDLYKEYGVHEGEDECEPEEEIEIDTRPRAVPLFPLWARTQWGHHSGAHGLDLSPRGHAFDRLDPSTDGEDEDEDEDEDENEEAESALFPGVRPSVPRGVSAPLFANDELSPALLDTHPASPALSEMASPQMTSPQAPALRESDGAGGPVACPDDSATVSADSPVVSSTPALALPADSSPPRPLLSSHARPLPLSSLHPPEPTTHELSPLLLGARPLLPGARTLPAWDHPSDALARTVGAAHVGVAGVSAVSDNPPSVQRHWPWEGPAPASEEESPVIRRLSLGPRPLPTLHSPRRPPPLTLPRSSSASPQHLTGPPATIHAPLSASTASSASPHASSLTPSPPSASSAASLGASAFLAPMEFAMPGVRPDRVDDDPTAGHGDTATVAREDEVVATHEDNDATVACEDEAAATHEDNDATVAREDEAAATHEDNDATVAHGEATDREGGGLSLDVPSPVWPPEHGLVEPERLHFADLESARSASTSVLTDASLSSRAFASPVASFSPSARSPASPFDPVVHVPPNSEPSARPQLHPPPMASLLPQSSRTHTPPPPAPPSAPSLRWVAPPTSSGPNTAHWAPAPPSAPFPPPPALPLSRETPSEHLRHTQAHSLHDERLRAEQEAAHMSPLRLPPRHTPYRRHTAPNIHAPAREQHAPREVGAPEGEAADFMDITPPPLLPFELSPSSPLSSLAPADHEAMPPRSAGASPSGPSSATVAPMELEEPESHSPQPASASPTATSPAQPHPWTPSTAEPGASLPSAHEPSAPAEATEQPSEPGQPAPSTAWHRAGVPSFHVRIDSGRPTSGRRDAEAGGAEETERSGAPGRMQGQLVFESGPLAFEGTLDLPGLLRLLRPLLTGQPAPSQGTDGRRGDFRFARDLFDHLLTTLGMHAAELGPAPAPERSAPSGPPRRRRRHHARPEEPADPFALPVTATDEERERHARVAGMSSAYHALPLDTSLSPEARTAPRPAPLGSGLACVDERAYAVCPTRRMRRGTRLLSRGAPPARRRRRPDTYRVTHIPETPVVLDLDHRGVAAPHRVRICSMAVQQGFLAVGGYDSRLVGMNMATREVFHNERLSAGHNCILNAIHISEVHGTPHFICSSNDDCVRLVTIPTGTVERLVFPCCINNAVLAPTGSPLAVVGDHKDAWLCCPRTGQVIHTLRGHLDYSFAAAWHPNGVLLATGNQDHTTKLWDTRYPSASLATLPGCMDSIRALSFSADGRFLVAGEGSDFAHIYHCSDFRREQTIDFFGDLCGLSFDPSGERLVLGISEENFGCVVELHRQHASSLKRILL